MTLDTPNKTVITALTLIIAPLVIAYFAMGLDHSGITSPFVYDNLDIIWQFSLTKVLKETGWILSIPNLGAPEVANWHYHSAAQTSALHSIIMLAMSPLFDSAITLQQTYYILNFPLIAITTYWACRLLSISRIPALSAALLFAFSTYRFNIVIYSFLSNYFTIPLVMVSIIWIVQGKFDQALTSNPLSIAIKSLFKSKYFLLGIFFIILVSLADGYYAFFSLLLFGCAGAIRFVVGGWKNPKTLVPVIIYIAILTITSLLIQLPLYQYKKSHHDEFFQNNVADPTLIKHPFEAEVYSSSLKLLLSPSPQHHIPALAHIGSRMLETTNAARSIPTFPTAPLGIVGSALLLLSFALLIIPQLRRTLLSGSDTTTQRDKNSIDLGDSLLAVVLFVFLTSISGGIGSLVALVFPTIRAYERFPIFLVFALLLIGALIASRALRTQRHTSLVIAALVVITAAGVYDQIPASAAVRSPEIRPRVAAETAFVSELESKLPKAAMVYQYPYSQYLTDNKYYGWGSFSHIRLYLFSHNIHWSNGGSKNSPADDWNQRISKLPLNEMLNEIRAVGFKAFVVDRTVIKGNEYGELKSALHQQQIDLIEDSSGQLAYALLPQNNLTVNYSENYKSIDSLTINSKPATNNNSYPELINAEQLEKFLSKNNVTFPLRIDRAQHPEIFDDLNAVRKGSGDFAIVPQTDLKATLSCSLPDEQNSIALDLTNDGPFSLTLGQGPFPISVGVHIKSKDGTMLLWDSGYRIPTNSTVKPGEKKRLVFDLKNYSAARQYLGDPANSLQFELVQDGNAWFSNVSCSSSL
ncbi:hypothetical protein [Pseudomonas putida]|uniref:hypothetical protein n=1 Tax=Pseudomonas putida TaxID=303 RepID=UPI0023662DCC|nr:hypothetical protein [Pseudomonas putida]MDD2046480.1 hypothetical protein [Pseudomonas putida]